MIRNENTQVAATTDVEFQNQVHILDTVVLGSTDLSEYTLLKADGDGNVLISTDGGTEAILLTGTNILDDAGLVAVLDGKADLDIGGKVVLSQLPAVSITSVSVVANQAAQLALSAEEGDVAVRSDNSTSYIKNAGTSGTITDWTLLATPGDLVLSVCGKTGAVSLDTTDITGLTAALSGKADTVHTHIVEDITDAPMTSSVVAYSDSDIASLSGPLTIDSVSVLAGERVLLGGQTANIDNGIWVVQAGAWTRPTDWPHGGSRNQLVSVKKANNSTSIYSNQIFGVRSANIGNTTPSIIPSANMSSTYFDRGINGVITIKSNVSLPGSPTTTTQAAADNSTKVATTAYVDTGLSGKAASSHTHAISDVTSLQTNIDRVNGYDIPGGHEAVASASQVLARVSIVRPFTIPINGTGSQGYASTTGTVATTTYSLQKNGSQFGTMQFAVATNAATFTVASATSFVAGDRLTVVAPASPNAALAAMSFTLVGSLT